MALFPYNYVRMSSDLHLLSCSPMGVFALPPPFHTVSFLDAQLTFNSAIIVVDAGSEKEMKTA